MQIAISLMSLPFRLIRAGNLNMLSDLNSIAISEHMATKFFGSTDCVGKTLIMKDGNKNEAFKIAGVFKDVPRQSVMQFDFVIPFSRFLTDNNWALETGATANLTWILLKNNVDRRLVEGKIKNLIKNQETTLNQELFMFPLKEQILYSYAGGKRVWKEMQSIVIIGAIGFAILLIACFNFINLAIALNFRRYREAGIKKVAGSGKSAIVIQFLGETLIITLISLLGAIFLVRILLSGFNSMFNYDIHLRLLDLSMIAFFLFSNTFYRPDLRIASCVISRIIQPCQCVERENKLPVKVTVSSGRALLYFNLQYQLYLSSV